MNDPYWTLDTSLFEGTFRYFGKEPMLVRGKVHTEKERYTNSDVNQEVTPIGRTFGTRTYLHMRPFVFIPDIRVTIGLFSQQRDDRAIGRVLAAQQAPKQKEVEVGNMQAWAYPDNTLVLWECFLHDFGRYLPLQADQNMLALWRSAETFLIGQFPRSERIVTTSHDPMFDTDEYQAMLAALGYAPVAKAAWGKGIEKQENAS